MLSLCFTFIFEYDVRWGLMKMHIKCFQIIEHLLCFWAGVDLKPCQTERYRGTAES